MKRKILGILLLVTLIFALTPLTAVASDGYNLIATGVQGTEDRITVDLPEGTTLSQFQSVSWEEWLVAGYPPHVDVRLDLNADGVYTSGTDAVLTFEYALNDSSHGTEAHTADSAYGALTGAWYATFSDDGAGPSSVTDTTGAWLSAAGTAPGPYDSATYVFGDSNFWFATLADWKSGQTIAAGGNTYDIGADSEVLYLEIEVDNWIVDTTAMIRAISVDFGGASATLSTVIADAPKVVSVVLDLGSVDFGTVYRGSTSGTKIVRVTNGGNVTVDVATAVSVGLDSPFNYLTITPDAFSVVPGEFVDVELVLSIPGDFPVGSYISAGALTFTATEQ